MANGYAVNVPGGGGILIETIMPTRRGAIVNWLVARKNIGVTVDHTDEDIEQLWRTFKDNGANPAYCIKVEISAVQGSDGNVTDKARA